MLVVDLEQFEIVTLFIIDGVAGVVSFGSIWRFVLLS